jgi:hypothetical protein
LELMKESLKKRFQEMEDEFDEDMGFIESV